MGAPGRDPGYEAQISVIGSMLIDARCVGPVMAALEAEDFQDPTCRSTFEAVRTLFLSGAKIDPVVVMDKLGGGEQRVDWIRQVMDLTPTAANVLDYAAIVRERAIRARVYTSACALAEQAMSEPMEALTRRAMAIPGLMSGSGRGRTVTAQELMADAVRRATSKQARDYLPWGIPSADRAMYIELGDLVLLGGRPSAGKTLLSVQMAIAQAAKYRVVYYTLETQPAKMGDRILAHIAQASLTNIKKSAPTEEEIGRIAQASNRFVTKTPIAFVHASHFTVDDIAADALSKRAQVVYIDYVQLIEGLGKTDYARVSGISRALKAFAQSNGIAVVALAQLSREDRVIRKDGTVLHLPPDMSSLKESGQLEQDADAVLLLWRLREEDNTGPRVLKLSKNKEGRKFSTVMKFDGPTQTMTDLQVNPKDYKPDENVAARFAAEGRAIKRANRAAAQMEQVEFRELPEGDRYEVPF